MPAARFAVALEPLEDIAAHGGDRIEFRFSANPGEPDARSRASRRAASARAYCSRSWSYWPTGATRARSCSTRSTRVSAARPPVAVGARLQRLAKVTQVVCVTHLAQIASWAGTHYVLRKYGDDDETTIEVVALHAQDDRLAEIARMLSANETHLARTRRDAGRFDQERTLARSWLR